MTVFDGRKFSGLRIIIITNLAGIEFRVFIFFTMSVNNNRLIKIYLQNIAELVSS